MKLFFMAALALMTAACSNSDNDILTPAEQPAKAQGIPFTATISMGESASTRALTEDNVNNKIVATWAVNDKVALIHNGVKDEMTVSAVNAGVATITGTITGSPSGGDAVTIIYPSDAADGTTGNVKSDWLSSQVGTLKGTSGTSIEEKYDVRKGSGALNASGTSLDGTVSLTNQNAIFKLTLKDIDGTNDVSATSVVISDQTGVVTTVTPASGYENAMYVALPTTATTLKFLVTGSDSKKYFNMASSLTLSASYYQSTIKLATVGHVIASNGKCYKDNSAIPSGESAVAKIAYLGNDAETSPTNTAFKNGLALALADVALEDVSGTKWCSEDSKTCLPTQYSTAETAKAMGDMAGIANTDALCSHASHTHNAAKAARDYSVTRPAGTSAWFLPSEGQWYKMSEAAGGYEKLGLLSTADGYWSSTESNAGSAWYYYDVNDGSWDDNSKADKNQVRACLAF